MRQIGLAPDDLDRLVITHFHDDHAGSAAEVSSWGAIQVVVHAADAPVIRGEVAGPPPNFTDFERALHARVAAGLPPAPIALHLPAHKVLSTGDIAAEYEGDVILGVFNLDRVTALASLRRLADLDVETACFGHGEPLMENASARLQHVTSALVTE